MLIDAKHNVELLNKFESSMACSEANVTGKIFHPQPTRASSTISFLTHNSADFQIAADWNRSAVHTVWCRRSTIYGACSANRTNARRDGALRHLSRGQGEGGLLGNGRRGTLSHRVGREDVATRNSISKQTSFETLCCLTKLP